MLFGHRRKLNIFTMCDKSGSGSALREIYRKQQKKRSTVCSKETRNTCDSWALVPWRREDGRRAGLGGDFFFLHWPGWTAKHSLPSWQPFSHSDQNKNLHSNFDLNPHLSLNLTHAPKLLVSETCTQTLWNKQVYIYISKKKAPSNKEPTTFLIEMRYPQCNSCFDKRSQS